MVNRNNEIILSAMDKLARSCRSGAIFFGAAAEALSACYQSQWAAIIPLDIDTAPPLTINADINAGPRSSDYDRLIKMTAPYIKVAVADNSASVHQVEIDIEENAGEDWQGAQNIHCRFCLVFDRMGRPAGYVAVWDTQDLEASDMLSLSHSSVAAQVSLKIEARAAPTTDVELFNEALDAIGDGFILYDADDKVAIYNQRQLELFPSVRNDVAKGARYEDLLRKQLGQGQVLEAIGKEEDWAAKSRAELKIDGFSKELAFADGRTIRLTNYQTRTGGTVALRTDITELVAARKSAIENEKLFRTLLENAPIPLTITVDRHFVYGNSFAYEVFGTDADGLIGKHVRDFYVDSAENDEVLDALKTRRVVSDYELRLRRTDGSEAIVLLDAAAISYKGDDAVFASVVDITARKQAEADQRRQEGELELAQELAQTGHWRLHFDSGRLEWSDEMYRIYGIEPNDLTMNLDSIRSMTHPEDIKALRGVYDCMSPEATTRNTDLRITRKDGLQRTLKGIVKGEFDEHGRLCAAFGVSRDITEQKENERSVAMSEARFRDLAEMSADWFWEMDAQLRFSYFSDRLHRITGVDTNHYIGKTRLETGQGSIEDEDWYRHLDDMENRRPFKDFRYTFEAEDGRCLYWSISGKPVFDEGGKFTGYRGSGSDITDRHDLETQLQQSQKMEAVGQLTGGVAHDFNNLLAVIQGNIELLKEDFQNKAEMSESQFDTILQATQRGAELTLSMLAFSRKQELQPTDLGLDEQVQTMVAMLKRTLGEAIEINVEHAENLWACRADPGQVDNALLNLALNARDAMPGGGTLSIETRNVILGDDGEKLPADVLPGKYVMLGVRDTGAGMDADTLAQVFEPFYTTKDVGKGTGLGLSMVYGFVKQSSGHLTISSRLGSGTTVRIYLPFSEARSEFPAENATATQIGGEETVLVLEDDQDLREITAQTLENIGYEVHRAEDGSSAIELLEHCGRIDLLLSDIRLPGPQNGPDIAQVAQEMHPGIQVLFMSGYRELTELDNKPHLKQIELLQKPFRKNDLVNKVRELLESGRN